MALPDESGKAGSKSKSAGEMGRDLSYHTPSAQAEDTPISVVFPRRLLLSPWLNIVGRGNRFHDLSTPGIPDIPNEQAMLVELNLDDTLLDFKTVRKSAPTHRIARKPLTTRARSRLSFVHF